MLDKKIIDYLKQEVVSKKKNPIFLETGFGIGTGALQALECGFSKIISIEIDNGIPTGNFEIHEGQSVT